MIKNWRDTFFEYFEKRKDFKKWEEHQQKKINKKIKKISKKPGNFR
jgi:hypothetical protein